ncbi:MAG TPA: aminopeptidase [Marinobacter sp.]|nr:aminopeptidase [Marinobacter sp.]
MTQLSQIYLVLLLLAVLPGCTTIGYYQQAIGGHLSLMWRAEPVGDRLADGTLDSALSEKLKTAQAARSFAAADLALPVGGAFSEYVPLDRPWVVVNLVAVPEFSLSPHQWCYPVVGCQAYRGYFQLEDAREEQTTFDQQGYDTFLGAVTAYSTLGWFDDPLHTGFTDLPEDRMVALMFHELAHRVVYVENDTAFNESFATAVELEGLRLWLAQRGDLEAFDRALRRLEHREHTLALVQSASADLASLYRQQGDLDDAVVRQRKQAMLEALARDYAELSKQFPEPGPLGVPPVTLNNARLALFQQYYQHVPAFRQLFREQAEDFDAFYQAVIALSEQPPEVRSAALAELSERFEEHF